jgi:hypothetical protein
MTKIYRIKLSELKKIVPTQKRQPPWWQEWHSTFKEYGLKWWGSTGKWYLPGNSGIGSPEYDLLITISHDSDGKPCFRIITSNMVKHKKYVERSFGKIVYPDDMIGFLEKFVAHTGVLE